MTTAGGRKVRDYSLRAIAVDAGSGKIRHDIELFKIVQPKPKTLHERNSFASPTSVIEKGAGVMFWALISGRYGTACVSIPAPATSSGKMTR